MAHLTSCALRYCVGVGSVQAAPSWYTTWADVARAVASATDGSHRWGKSQCWAKIKSMKAARLVHVSGEVRQRKNVTTPCTWLRKVCEVHSRCSASFFFKKKRKTHLFSLSLRRHHQQSPLRVGDRFKSQVERSFGISF